MPLVVFALPLVTSAAFSTVKTYIADALYIVNQLIKVAVAAALLIFFWGLAKFIRSAGDTRAQSEGRSLMIWGVIALFVIASVGGLVWFIQDNLGIYSMGLNVINVN